LDAIKLISPQGIQSAYLHQIPLPFTEWLHPSREWCTRFSS